MVKMQMVFRRWQKPRYSFRWAVPHFHRTFKSLELDFGKVSVFFLEELK